jgi:hypothetical protein
MIISYSLSLWERVRVRVLAKKRNEDSLSFSTPLDPLPSPLPKGEGVCKLFAEEN